MESALVASTLRAQETNIKIIWSSPRAF